MRRTNTRWGKKNQPRRPLFPTAGRAPRREVGVGPVPVVAVRVAIGQPRRGAGLDDAPVPRDGLAVHVERPRVPVRVVVLRADLLHVVCRHGQEADSIDLGATAQRRNDRRRFVILGSVPGLLGTLQA